MPVGMEVCDYLQGMEGNGHWAWMGIAAERPFSMGQHRFFWELVEVKSPKPSTMLLPDGCFRRDGMGQAW